MISIQFLTDGKDYYCVCAGRNEVHYSDHDMNQVMRDFKDYKMEDDNEVKSSDELKDLKSPSVNDMNINKPIPLKNYYQPLDIEEVDLEFNNEDVDFEEKTHNVKIRKPIINVFFSKYKIKITKEKGSKAKIQSFSKVKCDILKRDQYDLNNTLFDKYFDQRRISMIQDYVSIKNPINRVRSLGKFYGDFRTKSVDLGHHKIIVDPCHFLEKDCSVEFKKFLSKKLKEKPTFNKNQILLLYYQEISKKWAKYGWFWHNKNILCNSDYSSLYIFDEI